ncbi:polysaccharide lyase family 4 [Fusarium vanettenii 77-13-4]|uniref:rhamnogalacturonan endolyase n=1 Tax=Fusarium vanettenii (strain ATCC MYA-4622 / CBS 123669 / FGSC 9596 / NRRL 45880 / 77-13-4) TaxID=660122 RepID=C7YUD4_FUSV7|nr:polysaccharide lyase family 4 [Fusarium vanettenii 77-13-4]EEU44392.1 polysaccharide lyase family 4 [Fusarium vanettenii 77-13-4]
MKFRSVSLAALLLQAPQWVAAALKATESDTELVISNDRLYAAVQKPGGSIVKLTLDGTNLLGTRSGSTGQGPYLDCYCTPKGFWTPGTMTPKYKLFKGKDSSGKDYGGIMMADTFTETGQVLEQYWFLRDGETGLHTFSRVAYHNEEQPFLRNLQELRTMFRPNSEMWTHLLTNEKHYAPLPGKEAQSKQVVVQDATWYMGNTPDDAYVKQEADYFTKYTFQDNWRDIDAYGLFADGSKTEDGDAYGAWLVMNTKDTYFGGPLHSDLTVDGILYNYISSNHHGDQTPNITHGFDRTFGPQYYHFNRFPADTDILTAQADAAQYADPEWNADFYDSIAKHVPNYVPSKNRGTFEVRVDLPKGAKNPIAVLAQSGVDFQDNVFDVNAYQYWANLDGSGRATIPMVKAGMYRLTVYADGIFGQFTKDKIKIKAGKTEKTKVTWKEETSGKELWRIGTPDKTSGEYRHGFEPLTSKPLQPEQYRIYWAQYDFPKDYPDGVHFKVGESDVGKDLNYVHWSVFGGRANYVRPEAYVGNGDVNNWTIAFDLKESQVKRKKQATFTVQLAGAKTAAGNTDVYNASEPHSNLKYTVNINGKDLEPWVIPSCAVRSSVSCYNIAHKFVFDAGLLSKGENEIVLSLPYNATDYESAVLPASVYVQYDALRLEID